jgi:hypothetical protein
MTKKKELAKDARTIAAQMRFFAKPGAKFSTQSPPITFIPFATWFDEVAAALDPK